MTAAVLACALVGRASAADGGVPPASDGGVSPESAPAHDGGRPPDQPPAHYEERPLEGQVPMETVVTAGRRAEVLFQSPRSSSVVGRREMDERATRTTPEALEATPGVFVQQTNYGGGAPIIRGQVGNRILLLVDGIRLNNSTYRSGPNQFLNTIDPFAVDRIEIVRGLGSVANGSDAIGGTINVLTETPGIGREPAAVGQVQLRAGSADRSGAISGRAAWSGERAGLIATGSLRHFGNLRAGGGAVQPFTGYDEWSALFSGAWQPAPSRRVTFSLQTTQQYDVPRSDRSFPTDIRLFSLQLRQLAYLRFEQNLAGARLRRLRTTLSWNRQGERLDRLRLDRDLRTRDQATVDTLGLQLELDVAVPFSANPVTAGVDVYWDLIGTEAREGTLGGGALTLSPLDVRYPSGIGYATAGAFLIHDLVANESYRLTAEGRAGVVRLALPEDARIQALVPTAAPLPAFTEVVPVYALGLHGRRALGSHLALFAGATLGFRAPNVDDYARLGAEGPAFVIPTRGLRPERAWSGEVGLKGDWARARLSIAYAYTRISDALLRSPATLPMLDTIDDLPIGQVRNVESASYHTVEGAAVLPIWRQLSFSGMASYTRGALVAPAFTTDPNAPVLLVEQPANKVPPLFGRATIGWHARGGRWFAEGALRFSLAQTRLGEIDLGDARICPPVPGRCEGTSAWATFGIRGGIRVGRSIRLVGLVDNLTDNRYRPHASGVDGPGRSLVLMLEGYL